MKKTIAIAAVVLLGALAAAAQTSMPPNEVDSFKDTSALKPPSGARIAVMEFEDLECPHCALAAPVVRATVERDHIVYVHHDFLVHPTQWWSMDAALTARWLEDSVSPKIAEQFRLDIFAHQGNLASKDDLFRYTQDWLQKHGLQRPFAFDPKLRQEIQADQALGDRIGVNETPTIFVVTQHGWIQVKEFNQLQAAIAQGEKLAGPATPAPTVHNNVRKTTVPAK